MVLGGKRRPVGDRPAAGPIGDDLLLGQPQADAAALALDRRAQIADLGEQRAEIGGQVRVGVLGSALHLCPGDRRAPLPAVGVEVDRPEDGGAALARQQAAGALGERRRVERRLRVRRIDRHAARTRLGVERRRGPDEPADVGDRVADPVAAPAALDVKGLVEVA